MRRHDAWSKDEWVLLSLLDERGLILEDWPNGSLLRRCRVCALEFVPSRAGNRGPWPIECSDRCRRVYRAWNTEQWRTGNRQSPDTCVWCFGTMIKTPARNTVRYCSTACRLMARNHLTSNTELDRCELPRCPDCGLVGCQSRKTRRSDRSSTKRPRGRCRDCHRRWAREYELNRPIGPVRDRKRRRNRVIAAGDTMSSAQVIERFGNICYLCDHEIDVMIDDKRDPMYLHIDHIIPISRGGQHTWDNVAPTHARCNESKGAKLLAPPIGWNGTWTP